MTHPSSQSSTASEQAPAGALAPTGAPADFKGTRASLVNAGVGLAADPAAKMSGVICPEDIAVNACRRESGSTPERSTYLDDLELMRQRESERELLSQLRDVDSAQSENEMWAIASENAGIRRELLRLSGRRVEE